MMGKLMIYFSFDFRLTLDIFLYIQIRLYDWKSSVPFDTVLPIGYIFCLGNQCYELSN